uniref:Uncharacterized protein n=1 Tax=Arundo donax TaxID=35708 RepID=A0A0A8Z6K4_ARUDO
MIHLILLGIRILGSSFCCLQFRFLLVCQYLFDTSCMK